MGFWVAKATNRSRRCDIRTPTRGLAPFADCEAKECFMANETPKEPTTEPEQEVKQAQVNHKDKGTVVRTAFGEPMSGGIADIADGDDE
jgi:hypothetical protein